MRKIFVTSDTHYGHANILTFTAYDGSLIRPGFSSADEMDEFMIDAWNSVVNDDDIVYHLGDVCFSATTLHKVMPRLKGHKRLIYGNHDKLKPAEYAKYFKLKGSARYMGPPDIAAPIMLSHYPLHWMSFRHKGSNMCINVHGHIHEKVVLDVQGQPDLRYVNVAVERTGYKPLTIEQILEMNSCQ